METNKMVFLYWHIIHFVCTGKCLSSTIPLSTEAMPTQDVQVGIAEYKAGKNLRLVR